MIEARADEALKLENLADRLPPFERAQLLVAAAEEWASAGDAARAEQLYASAISDGGLVHGDARAHYARFLFDHDEPDHASEVLAALWNAHSKDPSVYLDVGELLLTQGDHEGANRRFNGGIARCAGVSVDADELAEFPELSDLMETRARERKFGGQPPDAWDETWFEHYERTNPGKRADHLWTAKHLEELKREATRLQDEKEILTSALHRSPSIIVPYWPPAEIEQAMVVFPVVFADLAGAVEPHLVHRRAVEAELQAADNGHGLFVARLSVRFVQEYAAYTGVEADSAETHQRFAVLSNLDGRGVAWPPGRNEPCWCGSARKYKKCCGAPGFTQ